MLEDTGRLPSADLGGADENANPLADDASAVFEGEGERLAVAADLNGPAQVFTMFPEVLALGRSRALHVVMSAACIGSGLGWIFVLPFVLSVFTSYGQPSALLYLATLLGGVSNFCYLPALSSLRNALTPDEGVGLDLLGLNERELSHDKTKSLERWRLILWNNGAMPLVLLGAFSFATPFLMSPEHFNEACNRVPVTGQVGAYFWVSLTHPIACVGMGPMLAHAWYLTMKVGAALAGPKVQRVIDEVKRGQPATHTDDWNENVNHRAVGLHVLMGELTTIWGPG